MGSSGSGLGTIFSRDISDLCVDQRPQVRGYKDCLPHGSCFCLLLCFKGPFPLYFAM